MKRAKYRAKPTTIRLPRKCHACEESGIVSYRKGIAGTQHACLAHIRKSKAEGPPRRTPAQVVAEFMATSNR